MGYEVMNIQRTALVNIEELSERDKFIRYIFQLKMVFQRIVELSKSVSYQIEGLIHYKQMRQEKFSEEQMNTFRICNEHIDMNTEKIDRHIEAIKEGWNEGIFEITVVNEDEQLTKAKNFIANMLELIRLGYDNLTYKRMIVNSIEE